MSKKTSNKKLFIKFAFFIVIIGAVIIAYISYPSKINKLSEADSFEERLEHKNMLLFENQKQEEFKEKTYKASSQDILTSTQQTINKEPYTNIKFNIETSSYDKLLDELAKIPAKNINSITNIVNQLLAYSGYPKNIVEVVYTKAEPFGSFDFSSGEIRIGDELLYRTNSIETIATLAHELDHFDKLAKTCKYIGIDEFEKVLNDNNIQINKTFWENASRFASLTSFKGEDYKNAIKRYITQNQNDINSPYSKFYTLSENMKNPLEISAYSISDYIFEHFKIQTRTNSLKQITETFNKIDLTKHNIVDSKPAIFDYLFLKAIVQTLPNFLNEYEICKTQKNEDFTSFWSQFKNNLKSFYEGEMDKRTASIILNLLEKTEELSKNNISDKEIEEALKYRINTLSSNLIFPNAIEILKHTTENHLNFINKNGVQDKEQELKDIMLLINIENKDYINTKNNDISLYYINIPKSLSKLYGIGKEKHKRFWFIYKNELFKSKLKPNQTEEELLKELIIENQLK